MSLDEKSALARFADSPIARLGTVTPEGKPHLVPVTFAIDDGFIFSMVDQKPKRTADLQRLANIGEEPAVSLIADFYDHDWTRLWWVRIDGEAGVVESGSNWSLAQRLLMAKYHQYWADPPLGPALIVAIENVTWWEWSP